MDAKEIKLQAQKELREEKETEARKKFAVKLRELEKAKQIIKNIEREIEDLEDELTHG